MTNPDTQTEGLPAEPPKVPVAKSDASYVVLKQDEGSIEKVATVTAEGPAEARKKVAEQWFENTKADEVELAAISSRYFQFKKLRNKVTREITEE
jgi:hypothetical protein